MRFAWFRRSLGRSDECTENFQLWHGSLGHTGSVSQELFERVVELDEADRESRNNANYAMHGVDLLAVGRMAAAFEDTDGIIALIRGDKRALPRVIASAADAEATEPAQAPC